MAKIVVLDDSHDILVQMKAFLENAGHTVFPMLRVEHGLDEIMKLKPDLVITDIIMPGVSGGAVYDALRAKLGKAFPIIICSGSGMKLKKKKSDALIYQIAKPVDYDFLLRKITELLQHAKEVRSELDADMD
jgi:two-component system, chemotaxis family, response regulator PixH